MQRITYLSLITLLFFAVLAHAQCGPNCLFYGGDLDLNSPNQDGLSNELDIPVPNAPAATPYGGATFQNFIAGGLGVKISGLFTNNLSDLNPTSAYWQIRSGVSLHTPGKLEASGFGTVGLGTFTHTPTGRSDFGYVEYHDGVSGLNITLNPGQYWFSVVPQAPYTVGRSFNSNSDGLNAVGNQTLNQQYFDSVYFHANFDDPSGYGGGVYPAFSSGVYGLQLAAESSQAPEPSSLMMLASGVVSVAGLLRRKLLA